jgi:hypothetical protein
LASGKEDIPVAASFSSGFGRMGSLIPLMLLPFIFDLVNYIGFLGIPTLFSIGVTFSTPISFPSIADFYTFPQYYPGLLPSSISLTSFQFFWYFPPWMILIVLSLVINSLFTGGFLGAILENNSSLGMRKVFLRYAVDRFGSILGLKIIVIVVSFLVLIPVTSLLSFGGPSLGFAILILLATLFVGYIFCLAPFIIVAENKKTVDSIRQAIRDAFTHRTLKFVVLYLVISSAFSFLLYLMMDINLFGLIAGIFLADFVGTALVASTMDFYLKSYWSARSTQ